MSFDEKADIVKGTAYSVNAPRRFHCTVSSFGSGWIEGGECMNLPHRLTEAMLDRFSHKSLHKSLTLNQIKCINVE